MNACLLPQIQAAIRDCLHVAKTERYQGIGEIADAMQVSRDVLYKWAQTGRIPATEIPSFERACADVALTRCLVAAQGYLLVPVAIDAPVDQLRLAQVHQHVAEAMLAAVEVDNNAVAAGAAVRSITKAINSLAALRHLYAQVKP